MVALGGGDTSGGCLGPLPVRGSNERTDKRGPKGNNLCVMRRYYLGDRDLVTTFFDPRSRLYKKQPIKKALQFASRSTVINYLSWISMDNYIKLFRMVANGMFCKKNQGVPR